MKPHEERTERKAVEKANKLARLDKDDRDEFVRVALTTRQGRAYMWWLLEITAVFHSPMTAEATRIAYNIGKQDIGREILAHMNQVAPAGYLEMQKEKMDEQTVTVTDDDDADG